MPNVDFSNVHDARCAPLARNDMLAKLLLRQHYGITRETWLWKSVDGHIDSMDTIGDAHLLNLERYLTGRGDLEFRPEDMTDNLALHEKLVLEEIARRGLEPHRNAHPGAFKRERERQELRNAEAQWYEEWHANLTHGDRR